MARSSDQVRREVCAVPYRIRDERAEFCLVSTERTSRWEFPHTEITGDQPPLNAAHRCVREQAGLACRVEACQPLDDVLATQNRQLVRMVAFLLEIQEAEPTAAQRRTRWCFAEEARARIRRKPMRRLIDLALRQIAGEAGQ